MTAPAIAAIIPVYNRATVVLEALESVRAQALAPACCVVVDDGSSDATADAVERWFADHAPPFAARVVRQDNAGPSVARNRGVDEARRVVDVDVLAFLDSDDLWPGDYLRRVAGVLGDETDVIAATADRLNVNLETGATELIRWDRIGESTTERFLVHGPPGTPNTAFTLRAFDAAGGYDPAFRTGQDYHLLLKLSLRGRWAHLPGEPVTVRRRVAEARQEAEQNSKRYADRRLIRARMLDQFIMRDGGREALPERAWRRRLGRTWHTAGKQLAALGRKPEARDCFRRAAEVYPAHLRARLRRWFT